MSEGPPDNSIEEPEETPTSIEEGPEAIPTEEGVRSIFEQLVGGAKFEEIKKIEDEQGLSEWEIEVSGEDGNIRYLYKRDAAYKLGIPIYAEYHNSDGDIIGGETVAKYKDGEWILTP